MVALGVVAVRYRWGVVALGVVAGKETEINRAHKTHNTKYRCRDIPGKLQYGVKVVPLDQIQYNYETPKILRSIFSVDSCLQSDNGVSTSNNCTVQYNEYSSVAQYSTVQYITV